jgi:hypothetical protein
MPTRPLGASRSSKQVLLDARGDLGGHAVEVGHPPRRRARGWSRRRSWPRSPCRAGAPSADRPSRPGRCARRRVARPRAMHARSQRSATRWSGPSLAGHVVLPDRGQELGVIWDQALLLVDRQVLDHSTGSSSRIADLSSPLASAGVAREPSLQPGVARGNGPAAGLSAAACRGCTYPVSRRGQEVGRTSGAPR